MKRSLGVRCMQTLLLLHNVEDPPTMPEEKRDWKLSPIKKSHDCSRKRRRTNYRSDLPASPPSPPRHSLFGDFEPVPVLEMKQRDAMLSGINHPPMYQQYLGQLRIAVYINYGLLTVHVMKAKNLTSRKSAKCNAYVKVCLVPSTDERSRCRTDTVLDTNNPLFDEKFSFELLDEDLKKRVYISVWNTDEKSKDEEFLGGMSFGVKHIYSMKRTVNGWYFLLSEALGKQKHLQAVCKKQSSNKQVKRRESRGKDILYMEPQSIVLKRTDQGFGFTFGGWKPAVVIKIEQGLAADRSGLKEGDWIMKINGINVSGSSTDSIGKMIRHCEKYLVLDVHRPQSVDSVDSTPLMRPPPCPLPPRHSHHSSGSDTDSDDDDICRSVSSMSSLDFQNGHDSRSSFSSIDSLQSWDDSRHTSSYKIKKQPSLGKSEKPQRKRRKTWNFIKESMMPSLMS